MSLCLKVSKGEGRLLQYPEDHPATLITVKNCRLLRINAKDLTRFGSLVKEYIQAAALQRRETLAQLSDRMCRVNDTLQVALASSRFMPGMRAAMHSTGWQSSTRVQCQRL